MDGDPLVAIVTFLLVVTTAVSIFVAWRLGKNQEDLQKRIAEEAKTRAQENVALQRSIANQQQEFAQRTHLIPLWQYMSSLSHIDPKKPITPDAIAVVNTLQFIAVCCEASVVDKGVIMRIFRDQYLEFCKEIENCGPLPGYSTPKTGRDLLAENTAAQDLCEELERDRRRRDTIRPMRNEETRHDRHDS